MGKKKEIPVHKVIVVGTGGVGKSALTLKFMYGDFVEEYDPTSADSYRKKIEIDGNEVNLDILDTAGQEEYAAMRDNYYRTGEGFMCVFSVALRASYEGLEEFHDQILRVTEDESIPFLLLGNKADLEGSREVESREGEELAKTFQCEYMETSAKTGLNVHESFTRIAALISASKGCEKKPKKGGCKIM